MRRLPLLCLLLIVLGMGAMLASAPAATASVSTPEHAWRWPLPGHPVVVRRFQPPPTPYSAGHRGVDLGAAAGTVVRAAGPGTVRYAGLVAGRGVVTVRHAGGLTTEYEPVRALVSAGERVAAGDRIGVVDGRHLGCVRSCLHWGLRRGATYLDPLSLLGGGPVRLLPQRAQPDDRADITVMLPLPPPDALDSFTRAAARPDQLPDDSRDDGRSSVAVSVLAASASSAVSAAIVRRRRVRALRRAVPPWP